MWDRPSCTSDALNTMNFNVLIVNECSTCRPITRESLVYTLPSYCDGNSANSLIVCGHAGCSSSGPERVTSPTAWVWFTCSASHPYLRCSSTWEPFILLVNATVPPCMHGNIRTLRWITYGFVLSLSCAPAGVNGSDLSVRGGRLPAHQLLQLQLLAVRGSVSGRPHLPALHSARQTQASEGTSFCRCCITASSFPLKAGDGWRGREERETKQTLCKES